MKNQISVYINEIPNNWKGETLQSAVYGFILYSRVSLKEACAGGFHWGFGQAVSNIAVPTFETLKSKNCTAVLKVFTRNFIVFSFTFRDLKKGATYGVFFSVAKSIDILVRHLLKDSAYCNTLCSSIDSAVTSTFLTFDPLKGLKAGSLDLVIGILYENTKTYIKERIEEHNILEWGFLKLKMEDFPPRWGNIYATIFKKVFVNSTLNCSMQASLINGISVATFLCLAPIIFKQTILADSRKIYKELNNIELLKPILKSFTDSLVICF